MSLIRGNVVDNATSYELYEKMIPKTEGEITQTTYANVGYVALSNGQIAGLSSTWIHSDFIEIANLRNNPTYCVGRLTGHSAVAPVAYYSDASFASFLSTVAYEQKAELTSEYVKEKAPENAKYIIFSTDSASNTLTVSTISGAAEPIYTLIGSANEINFDTTTLGLATGDHTLVVKAKADGFEDSDYSNEVVATIP